MTKYSHNSTDKWIWTRATQDDITGILTLCDINFKCEADTVFETSWNVMARNLTLSVVNQQYSPKNEIVCVAKIDDRVVGYFWAIRGRFMEYSLDEMSEVRFIHCDQSLSVRDRVRIVAQSLEIWELWAIINQIRVLASTTMRDSQRGFLKLHEQAGYSVRGSCCYKRVISLTNELSNQPLPE